MPFFNTLKNAFQVASIATPTNISIIMNQSYKSRYVFGSITDAENQDMSLELPPDSVHDDDAASRWSLVNFGQGPTLGNKDHITTFRALSPIEKKKQTVSHCNRFHINPLALWKRIITV